MLAFYYFRCRLYDAEGKDLFLQKMNNKERLDNDKDAVLFILNFVFSRYTVALAIKHI